MNLRKALDFIKKINDKVNYIQRLKANTFVARVDETGEKYRIKCNKTCFVYIKEEGIN